MSLLTSTGSTVGRRNVVNGSKSVFSRKVGPFWGLIKIFNNFPYLLQKYRKFPTPECYACGEPSNRHNFACVTVTGIEKILGSMA